MKKILLMMGVAALTLSSCSQEEVLSVNTSKDDNAISFRVRSAKQARSMEYSTYNLDEFMVYGFKGWPEDNYEAGEDLVEYFEEKFSDNGEGLFTSATPYYYPTDGSWLYFAAFAPADLKMEKLPYGGITLKNFTVDTDITKQIDIICDNGGSNLEKDDPDQEFTFKHALTKVFVSKLINNDTRYKYEIAGIKFGNIANSGELIYRGVKDLDITGDEELGVYDVEGYLSDPIGDGIHWKAAEQTEDMVYIFDAPLVLDEETTSVYPMTGNDTGAEDNAGFQDGAGNGGFMLIPQKLSKEYVNDEGNIEDEFGDGMSYVAFLVRITYLPQNELVYPYAEGVEAITETIGEGEDAVEYAWAAFPVSSLWRPETYMDYVVDFSKGAGFVAPGAGDEVVYQPILGREIRFTETVLFWPENNDETVDQENAINIDGGNVDDPFGD